MADSQTCGLFDVQTITPHSLVMQKNVGYWQWIVSVVDRSVIDVLCCCQDVVTVTGFTVQMETKSVHRDYHDMHITAMPSSSLIVWVN